MARDSVLITADSLASLAGAVTILDCRFDLFDPASAREAYAESHVPGAAFADLDLDLAADANDSTGRHPLPEPGIAEKTFRRLGVSNNRGVVVYDQGGGALAARCWWMLRWLGHDDVRLLDGGFGAWCAGGHPTESGDYEPVPGTFSAMPSDALVVDAAQVQQALEDGWPLCDARDPERFAGHVEPIDAVAGHIPGAVNVPFARFLDEDGRFRDDDAVRAMLEPVVADGPWITMCGSGVTACHLALAAEIAGLAAPRLYAGSWSEWIRDPARPVARAD